MAIAPLLSQRASVVLVSLPGHRPSMTIDSASAIAVSDISEGGVPAATMRGSDRAPVTAAAL